MRRAHGWIVLAVLAVAAVNWLGWRAVQPPATGDSAENAALWHDLGGVVTVGDEHRFPPALQAHADQRLTLTGVVFTLPQLIDHGMLTAAVLAPPAKFACCGLRCDAGGTALCILPRSPTADPGQRRLARVSGVLCLKPQAGSLTALDLVDAEITWLPDP